MQIKNYVTEFIGTFFLVMTIGLVVTGDRTSTPYLLAPVAIGSVLMVMVYMGGHVSGAHYNPAVSLAACLRGKLAPRELIPYWASQLIGAILASLVVYALIGKTFAPEPAANVGAGRAVAVEALFTFALALVVLNSATATGTAGNSFYGLAIGFTVLAGATAGGGISGGAFNPAVGTGPLLVRAMITHESMAALWIYWVGPLAGGALAAGVFMLQNEWNRQPATIVVPPGQTIPS